MLFDNKSINLRKFNDDYISDPVPLSIGDYKLTKFFIVDSNDSVMFASPVENSSLAHLVSNPLPYEFYIEKDFVTKVSPEVISTKNKSPGDFGYSSFRFSVVETIDFLLTVFTYNESIANYELSSAKLNITSGTETIYEADLQKFTNKITISANYSNYELSITKDGYRSYNFVFPIDSIAQHWTSPLTIILIPSAMPEEGLIAYYPFDDNISDYSGMENHCIDSSEGIFAEGVLGSSLHFNGKTDYLTLTNTLNGSKGLTFSFWIKSEGLLEGENNGAIITKYNMFSDYTCFLVSTSPYLTNENGLHGTYYASKSTTDIRDFAWSELTSINDIPPHLNAEKITILNPTGFELNAWTHCVINVTDTEIQAWVNGVLTVKKTREYSTYLDDDMEPTYIGNVMNGGQGSNNHYHGFLDELRVYNRGLSPEEISILYENK